MKRLWLFMVCFLAFPAMATDVDFYGGLEKSSMPHSQMRLMGIYPHALPENMNIVAYYSPVEDATTRHGETLAYGLLPDGFWAQEVLLREGQAMVMPVYETHWGRLYTLKNAEVEARIAKRGLWANDPVVCAREANRAFDSFSIVQGTITDAANVRGTIYFNFGADYRDDFTVKITRRAFRSLPLGTQDQLTRLTESPNPDMVIEARGWVFFSGGPMIEVKQDAQLDFYGPDDLFKIERCNS